MYLVISILTLAVVADFATGRIPNSLFYFAFLISQLWGITEHGVEYAAVSLVGAILLAMIVFPFFAIGALGGGDIKLLMVLPGFFNYKATVDILVYSFLLAAIVGVVKLLRNKILVSRLLYLLDYLKLVSITGKFIKYDNHEFLRESQIASYQIHFTLYILISAAMKVGGIT